MIIIPLVMLQTLFVQMPSGTTYKAVDDVPAGACVLGADKEVLVYDETSINKCVEVELEPGCYRAELRGGVGTSNEICLDVVSQNIVPVTSALFALGEKTKVYVFRGGDGNPGGVNLVSGRDVAGSVGGGASGLDSVLIVGDDIWRADGGAGKTCVHPNTYTMVNMTSNGISQGVGLGGKSGLGGLSEQGAGCDYTDGVYYTVSAGGGGAPNDTGGGLVSCNFVSDKIVLNVGSAGTNEGGGNGGAVTSCTSRDCTETITVAGGVGGKNIKYTCGGHDIISYGGGGGGGSIRASGDLWIAQGGDGGSGSTGTSDVSFVRIYKM